MKELHGVKELRSLLGVKTDKQYFETEFLYISNNNIIESYKRRVTWYLTGKGKELARISSLLWKK